MTNPCRVLVVDDNRDAAEMIGSVLEAFGLETLAVSGGLAGVAAVAAFAPHVVFLDLGMPDLSGYDVARHVRAMVLPVPPLLVALTGWSDEDTVRRVAAAGFDGHLCKPATVAQLMHWVERRPRTATATAPSLPA